MMLSDLIEVNREALITLLNSSTEQCVYFAIDRRNNKSLHMRFAGSSGYAMPMFISNYLTPDPTD